MKKLILVSLASVLMFAPAANAAQFELIKPIDSIKGDKIVLPDGTSFEFVTKRTSRRTRSRLRFLTRCFVAQGKEIECGMLADVGYVDRARIVISGGVVKELHVLELMQ